jgi:hypothetical protein
VARALFAANVLPIVRQIQAAGATTLAQIAEVLNGGVQTARGIRARSRTGSIARKSSRA